MLSAAAVDGQKIRRGNCWRSGVRAQDVIAAEFEMGRSHTSIDIVIVHVKGKKCVSTTTLPSRFGSPKTTGHRRTRRT